MAKSKTGSMIVVYEVIGFGIIIALSWANEVTGMPHLLTGGSRTAGWTESLLETAVILLVAVPVVALTSRTVSRLHYLEEFLNICAWCRKLNCDGRWLSVEEYFQSGFETKTSHGMCPACSATMKKGVVKT